MPSSVAAVKVQCTKGCSDPLKKYPGLVLFLPHPTASSEGSALVWGWKVLSNSIGCGKEVFGTVPSARGVLR